MTPPVRERYLFRKALQYGMVELSADQGRVCLYSDAVFFTVLHNGPLLAERVQLITWKGHKAINQPNLSLRIR